MPKGPGVVVADATTPTQTVGVNASGQAAIQDPPNLDVAASTLATEAKLEAVRALLATIDADTSNIDTALSTRAAETTLQAVRDRIGEISATPTANTVQDRLKELEATLTSIDGKDFATQTTLATLATETKLEAVRVLLASLDGKDYATQTTLAAILVDTGQIETLLGTIDADTSILSVPTQDYDTGGGTDTMVMRGIALPASGGNVIGGTATDPVRVDPTDDTQQSVKLYDHNGNSIFVQDGVAYPAGNDHLLVGGVHESNGNTYHARMRDDTTTAALKRVMVEAAIAPGSQITTLSGGGAVTQESFTEFLTNGTYAEDMVQDGSGGDIIYEYPADATNNTHLTGLRLTFSANSFNFNGDSFGKSGAALPTGLLIRYTVNGGSSRDLATVMINEDFMRLLEFSISQAGNEDAMAASVIFGGDTILEAGTGDKIEVLVRDDLTSNNYGIFYLTATLYGFEVVP